MKFEINQFNYKTLPQLADFLRRNKTKKESNFIKIVKFDIIPKYGNITVIGNLIII